MYKGSGALDLGRDGVGIGLYLIVYNGLNNYSSIEENEILRLLEVWSNIQTINKFACPTLKKKIYPS